MRIIIPMSGTGRRFINAGYKAPKPLIEVDGKPVIEHVVNLFPSESNFIFICNTDHLSKTNLAEVLERIAPKARIVEIRPHKLGPVYAVSKAFDLIDDTDEAIINYCDFSKYWNYDDFLQDTRARFADGAISAYRGFHPHMLGATNYAFIKDEDRWMLEIREKMPFTDNRMEEYASDGTYYFKEGRHVKKYFKELMDRKISTNGEYYVSMVYNLMRQDGLKISVYEIEHMLQWGSPRDLEEYKKWSDYFRRIVKPLRDIKSEKNSINLIPLAGGGKRFASEGYKLPKPLIDVNGRPMVIQAARSLPCSEKNIFVCLGEHLDNYPLKKSIEKTYPSAKIVRIGHPTEGQACTCEIGLAGEDIQSPLLIAACDTAVLWDEKRYERLIDDKGVDSIIWTSRNHVPAEHNPKMYGWLKVDEEGNVLGASVKIPISDDPYQDRVIIGTFYFRKCGYFLEALKRIYKKNIRVNGEFYVDSCVNELIGMGLKVKNFQVDNYICWGTPDELKIYEYWRSFFHKSDWHPYRMEKNVTNEIIHCDTLLQ